MIVNRWPAVDTSTGGQRAGGQEGRMKMIVNHRLCEACALTVCAVATDRRPGEVLVGISLVEVNDLADAVLGLVARAAAIELIHMVFTST
jgi:hypothetical protein